MDIPEMRQAEAILQRLVLEAALKEQFAAAHASGNQARATPQPCKPELQYPTRALSEDRPLTKYSVRTEGGGARRQRSTSSWP